MGHWRVWRRDGSIGVMTFVCVLTSISLYQVAALPYTIGYAPLSEAVAYSVAFASLVNRAGTVVAASSDSVSFAVMEKGGNLDAHLNSQLVDGSSAHAWPVGSCCCGTSSCCSSRVVES